MNEHDEPAFAYPEITGYYLSWLASLARLQPEIDTHPAALAAVEWLQTITSFDHPPATRYYFDDSDDWRNDATFTFDLAMMCRGLHAVRGMVPERPRKQLLQKLLRHVLPPGNSLPVFINARGELPDRWSTRPGPFQLKTAAALLPFERHPAIWSTFYRWRGRILEEVDSGELHAAFYALEGLMQFAISGKPEAIHEVANCFEALLSNRLEELRFRLETFVSESGAISFRSGGYRPTHFNTWATIFAYQCFNDTDIPSIVLCQLPG